MKIIIAVTILVIITSGCVERKLIINSEPQGAVVYVDGSKIGQTPVEMKFVHYGTRRVVVEKEGFKNIDRLVKIYPPWYEFFPFEIISETLLPFTITDKTNLEFKMEKVEPEDTNVLRKRAEEMRKETFEKE